MIEIKDFNVLDYLKTPEDVSGYLEAAMEENDPEFLISVIRDILQSEGYTKMAKKTGLTREGLYNSFSGETDPRIGTIYKVLNSVGLTLSVVPMRG
jgi:probable addiction module antidote protein